MFLRYLKILSEIHKILKPTTYLEIGSRRGNSLSLSNCLSIAIDPEFRIIEEILAPTRLYKRTSDDFFKEVDVLKVFGKRIDFAFIDGMHLAEFSLRDFINVERFCHPDSVIVIDDALPKEIEQTSREFKKGFWTGDVYILLLILKKFRPDLTINIIETKFKGIAVITNLSPQSQILSDNYPSIEKDILNGNYNLNTVEEIRNNYTFASINDLSNIILTKQNEGIQ